MVSKWNCICDCECRTTDYSLSIYLSVSFVDRVHIRFSSQLGPACRHTHTQSVTKRKNNRQIRSTKSVPKQINIVVIPPPIIVQWHLIILPFRSNCSRSILCTLFGHCYSININFYDWLFIRCVYIRFSIYSQNCLMTVFIRFTWFV